MDHACENHLQIALPSRDELKPLLMKLGPQGARVELAEGRRLPTRLASLVPDDS